MYAIYENKNLPKTLKKIPKEIQKRYEVWKRIVEMDGVEGLRNIKGFHDEALKGTWKGFRSSRLNIQWRVIYEVEKAEFKVYVIEINTHQY